MSDMSKLLIATKNMGKVREICGMLQEFSWDVISVVDFPDIEEAPETADTFMGNALQKAEYYVNATGYACIADDSGLEVDALQGAPGIFSARFAGDEADARKNNEKLLRELQDVDQEKRTARFRCAMVFLHPDGTLIKAAGKCEGYILSEYRGKDGFGYDPLFYFPPLNKALAELSKDEKSLISHRGEALRELVKKIIEVYGDAYRSIK